MKMDETLVKALQHLLWHHECVVLPGFGAFIARYEPAKILTSQHKIVPPTKFFSFNQRLKNNDGLLIAEIQRIDACSYDEAKAKVSFFVEDALQMLHQKKSLVVAKVGKWDINSDGNFVFVPDKSVNYSVAAFGLSAIDANAFQKNVKLQPVLSNEHEEIAQEQVFKEQQHQNNRRKYRIAAALLPFLLAAGIAQLLWMEARENNLQFNSIDFSHIITAFFHEAPEQKMLLNADFDVDFKNAAPIRPTENQIFFPENHPQLKLGAAITPINQKDLSPGYYVIIGSFKDFDNAFLAQKKYNKKGYSTAILPGESDFLRVGIFVSESPSNAYVQLQHIKSKFQKHAWLMHNV